MDKIIMFFTDYYYIFIILSIFMIISLLGFNIMDGRSKVKDEIRDIPEQTPTIPDEPIPEQNIM